MLVEPELEFSASPELDFQASPPLDLHLVSLDFQASLELEPFQAIVDFHQLVFKPSLEVDFHELGYMG